MMNAAMLVILLTGMALETQARPFYIGGIKIAVRAKWSITFGDCQDGHGICIAIFVGEGSAAPDLFIGYDRDTDKINVKVGKRERLSGSFSNGTFELPEDSPVDPAVIKKLPNFPRIDRTVMIRRGSYKVTGEGDYYIVSFDYFLQ